VAARLSYRGVRAAGCGSGPPPPAGLRWLLPDDPLPLLAMWPRDTMLASESSAATAGGNIRRGRPRAGREGDAWAFHPLSGQLAAGDPSLSPNRARRGRRPPDDVGQRRQLTEAAAIAAALSSENILSWSGHMDEGLHGIVRCMEVSSTQRIPVCAPNCAVEAYLG